MPTLAPATVDNYWSDGYVFPVRMFDIDEAREWRTRFGALEAAAEAADLPEPFADYARANQSGPTDREHLLGRR